MSTIHEILLHREKPLKKDTAREVRFRGTVTALDSIYGYLVAQDGADGIRVNLQTSLEYPAVGDEIEVMGQASRVGPATWISNAVTRVVGKGRLPAAVRLDARHPPGNELDNQRVSLRGVVRTVHPDGLGRATLSIDPFLPLPGSARPVSALITDDEPESYKTYLDAEVEVTGVFSATTDVDERFDGFSLLVADLSGVDILVEAPDPNRLPPETIARLLGRRGNLPKHQVRVRGQLQTGPDKQLQLSDGTGSLAVKVAADSVLAPNTSVEGVGFLRKGLGGLELAEFHPLSENRGQKTEATRHSVITKTAAIQHLSPAQAAERWPVEIDGVLTYWEPQHSIAFVQDDSGGIYLSLLQTEESHLRTNTALRAGVHVRVKGLSAPGDFAPVIERPQIKVIGPGTLPQPLAIASEDIFSGRADSQWVKLEGIVENTGSAGGQAIATVAVGAHRFEVRFPASAGIPSAWIDRKIELEGVCGSLYNSKRQLIGINVSVPSPAQVRLVDDGAHAQGNATATPIAELLQYHPGEDPGHRVHLQGVVTAQDPSGPVWIQDESGAVSISTHNQIALRPGDRVGVLGFAAPGSFSPLLYDATISRLGHGAPVRPERVTGEALMSGGYDEHLVEVDGRVVDHYQTGKEEIFRLQAGKISFGLRTRSQLPDYEDGTILRVTGILLLTGRMSHANYVPDSFEIFAGSERDVKVLRAAPWLRSDRLFRALAVTLSVVVAILTWVFFLKRRVRQQTATISQKLREVESLRVAADAANAAKSAFLANMSHEIRTPMNGILGLAELTLAGDLEADQRSNITGLKSSAESLLVVINDILDFSKIEAGKLQLESVEFDLREQVEESTASLALRASEKKLELTCGIKKDLPDFIVGDPTRLRQILTNLVANAIKFTEQGEVNVFVDGDGPAIAESGEIVLHFRVSDTGIGIAPAKQKDIFSAFVQADSSTTREFGGTGLGLSITKEFVEMMGGEIWLESEPGRGSTFHFTARFGRSPRRRRMEQNGTDAWLRGAGVLVVDDNASARKLTAAYLSELGAEVSEAESGRAALLELRKACGKGRGFSLAVIDGQMPGLDGIGLLEMIRQDPSLERIKTILLTLPAGRIERQRSNELRLAAQVNKPLRLGELREAIAGLSAAAPAPAVASKTRRREPAEAGGHACPLLIAEDNAINQRVIQGMITRLGYQARLVGSGEEAVRAIEERAFELVLMDVQMPKMDGFAATAAIRRLEPALGRRHTIIAMTAHAMAGDRERCLAAGMDDYLAKPIDFKRLKEILEKNAAVETPHLQGIA